MTALPNKKCSVQQNATEKGQKALGKDICQKRGQKASSAAVERRR